jgi:hypothetical protein
MRLHNRFLLLILLLSTTLSSNANTTENEPVHAGFIYDRSPLVLDEGERTEIVGPLYYSEAKNSEEYTWAFPPLYSYYTNAAIGASESDYLYPILTRENYGSENRWQFCQLFSWAGGELPAGTSQRRFTIFPLYFQQRSADTNDNYTALAPFYGHLKNRLFRDEIYFIMFPAYAETRKRDVVTDNYCYPIVDVRHGDGLHGWQVWPLVGEEHKVITYDTNGFGDVTLNPGHDSFFALWPFFLKQDNGLGTADPEKFRASLPLFAVTRSPLRDSTSIVWPIFTWVNERGRQYHEWEGPWPIVIFARGPGKHTDRIWPVFSQSATTNMESDSYLWPIYQYHRLHADPLDLKRTRVLFYVYVNVIEKNTETGKQKKRLDMWPFFIWRQQTDGHTRLQVFAPFESVLGENRGLERNWSPLWSLWRAEHNPKTGAARQSLLWNLYRRQTTPDSKKCSLLFGLFQYQSTGKDHKTRLFYLTVSDTHVHPKKI